MLTKWATSITLLTLAAVMALTCCGRVGENPQEGSSLGGASDISGSIGSQSGGQADMSGWIIALISKEDSIARVAEIDSAGLFTFTHVFVNQTFTIALLSPSYVLRAMLTHPDKSGNLLTHFRINGRTLPRLTHKGPLIHMNADDGVTFTNDKANDDDKDGVPDGLNALNLSALPGALDRRPLLGLAATDTDKDGLDNTLDPDIDGDGVPNIFDTDDDNDGIYDAFDQDGNGDLIPDNQQAAGDLYFNSGVKWLIVKYEMVPQGGGTFERSLTFLAQLHKQQTQTPIGLQVRGANSLLDESLVESYSSSGSSIPEAWDRLLMDDGQNEDSASEDGLYARRIILATGRAPIANQVIFFQLTNGTIAKPWFQEFAYTFAAITPTAITPSFDIATRTVTLGGDPFGEIEDFVWIVTVYQVVGSNNVRVYSSPATNGGERSFILPSNVLEAGQSYRYKVTAESIDRVAGYASYSIESEVLDIPESP